MFGIKNARRSACQDELVVGRRVYQSFSVCQTGRLLDDNITLSDDLFQTSGSCNRLTRGCLSPRKKKSVHLLAGDGQVCSLGRHPAIKVNSPLRIGISEPRRGDNDRSSFAGFIDLHKHCRNRLPVPLCCQRPPVAVELDARGLDDIGVLPEAGSPRVNRHRGSAMCRHAAAGDVNGIRRGKQSAVGLLFKLAVSALDVTVRQRVAGGSIEAHGARRRGHARFDDPR